MIPLALRLSRRSIGILYTFSLACTAALGAVLVVRTRSPSAAASDWIGIAAFSGLVACALVGIFTGAFSHRPAEIARRYVHRLPAKWRASFDTVDPDLKDLDAATMLKIHDRGEAEQLRARLVAYIFKEPGFPRRVMPARVEDASRDPWLASLRRVARAERLVIEMEHGVTSHAYLLHPPREKGVLVVHHEGHDLDPAPGLRSIQAFLDEGFPVLALWMPLLGPNPAPVTDVPGVGLWRLRGHDHFAFLETDSFSPIKFFVQPVIVALNHAESVGYAKFAMVGVSGGAWTTTLAAALDARITRSYPVGGSVPLPYWTEPDGNFGDYEAHHAGLLRVADYLDLYVLGGWGEGRRQVLVMNKYDPVCFSGSSPLLYGDAVKKRVESLGAGSFDLLLDDTHTAHALSAAARALVVGELDDLARSAAPHQADRASAELAIRHEDVVG